MNKIKPFYLFLCLGVVLSLLFSSGQVENPDTHLRLTQSRLMLFEGKLGLSEQMGEDSHGNVATNQLGERYMVYNPGQSLIFIPIYWLASITSENDAENYYNSAFLVSFLNMLIHAFCSFVLFRISYLLSLSLNKSYFVAFVFCLTSYSFSFAQSTYEHHFEMLSILLGFYFILDKNVNNRVFLAGVAISIGLIFRTTTIFALPALMMLCERKQWLYLFLGTSIGILIIAFYNYFRFHNFLESGYDIAWRLANGDNIDFWSLKRIPTALFGLLLSPAKGLLIFSPTILFGFFSMKKFFLLNPKISWSILILCTVYLLIFSMNFAWHGSIWSFGPRYILPILPFLYLPLIYLNVKKWHYVVFVIASMSQVLLMSVNYKRELLEQLYISKSINEIEFLNQTKNIPYLYQVKQLNEIIPKNFNGSLRNYFPNCPWKKEIRTGTTEQVLNYSIEKNSINFWWARVFNWRTHLLSRIFTIIILLFSIFGLFYFIRNAKKIF